MRKMVGLSVASDVLWIRSPIAMGIMELPPSPSAKIQWYLMHWRCLWLRFKIIFRYQSFDQRCLFFSCLVLNRPLIRPGSPDGPEKWSTGYEAIFSVYMVLLLLLLSLEFGFDIPILTNPAVFQERRRKRSISCKVISRLLVLEFHD